MVEMTASCSKGLESISGMLANFGEQMPKALPLMTRKAGAFVCDSCRARTKKAKKYAPKSEWSAQPSPHPPKYITYKNGKKLEKPLHRWQLLRKIGTPDINAHDYYVYCHYKQKKNGKIVQDLTAEKKELKEFHLKIFHSGLAKQSWNWAKGEIASGVSGRNGDVVWRRRKRDRRNPRDAISGKFEQVKSVVESGATVEIHNKLDYISAACPDSSISEAVEAAKKKLSWEIDKKLQQFIDQTTHSQFFGKDGYPLYRQDWNGLEKAMNPAGYARAW